MPIAAALESAILACLEKSRARRPQTARDLAMLIGRCVDAGQWSVEEADAWWGRHERGQSIVAAPPTLNTRSSGDHAMTIDH